MKTKQFWHYTHKVQVQQVLSQTKCRCSINNNWLILLTEASGETIDYNIVFISHYIKNETLPMNSLKSKMHSHLSLMLHLLPYYSLDILQMCSQLSG